MTTRLFTLRDFEPPAAGRARPPLSNLVRLGADHLALASSLSHADGAAVSVRVMAVAGAVAQRVKDDVERAVACPSPAGSVGPAFLHRNISRGATDPARVTEEHLSGPGNRRFSAGSLPVFPLTPS